MFSFPRIYTVIVYASLVLCQRLQNNFLDSPRGYAVYPDEAQVYIAHPGQYRLLHYSTPLQLRLVPDLLLDMLGRSSLFILLASALSVSAAPQLSVKLSGAWQVNDASDLKVTATVTNTGDETLKLLNDPRGPLSNKLPTETFQITHQDSGAKPSFTGAVVSLSLQAIASTFLIMSSGQVRAIDCYQNWRRRCFHCPRSWPVCERRTRP